MCFLPPHILMFRTEIDSLRHLSVYVCGRHFRLLSVRIDFSSTVANNFFSQGQSTE